MFINIQGNSLASLLVGISQILVVLVWPLTLLIIFFTIKIPIANFIGKWKNGSVELPGGFKLIASTQQVEEVSDEQKAFPNILKTHAKSKGEQARDTLLLENFYERTYRLIFHSQLNLLLAADQSTSISRNSIVDMYNTTQWVNSYPFEQYMTFLTNFGLLQYNGDDQSYTITQLGRLFIKYLKQNNIPLNKLPEDWKNQGD